MSVYGRILLAGLGSALLLLAAFGYQYLGELQPCVLCIWQRWPHAVAIVVAALAMTVLWRVRRPLSALGALIMAVGVGLGGYHVGVEQGLWEGPGACTVEIDPSSMTTDELLAQIEGAALVRCDEVVWDFLGISMAGWNALLSLGLGVLWVFAAIPRATNRHEAAT